MQCQRGGSNMDVVAFISNIVTIISAIVTCVNCIFHWFDKESQKV